MIKFFRKFKLASLLLVCFLLSGCTVGDKMEWLDKKAGEVFKNFQAEQVEKTINVMEPMKNMSAKDLSDEQKEQIDKWLAENSFNRYGDPVDTIYAGGTPLFNEVTGETIERFEYILEKQSDILQKIK